MSSATNSMIFYFLFFGCEKYYYMEFLVSKKIMRELIIKGQERIKSTEVCVVLKVLVWYIYTYT